MAVIKTLKEAMDEMKFDTRLIETKINQGLLTKEEVQKHLASLEDSAANSVALNLDGEDEVMDDEIDESELDQADTEEPEESH